MAGREKTGRKQDGTFAAGTSGNPSGRPKGRRNAATMLLAELVDDEGALIVKRLISEAKKGHPVAMRLAIERLIPRLERRIEVDLPRVEKAADIAGAVARVIELAACGELTIEEARAFMALLEQQRKTIETSDLAVRLELLEQQGKEW